MRILLVSLLASGAAFASESNSVKDSVADSSAKPVASSPRHPQPKAPARWDGAPLQFIAGAGGGLLGGLGGVTLGATTGFILGARSASASCEGESGECSNEKVGWSVLIGAGIGFLVGVPIGATAGVLSAAPDDFASEAVFLPFLGSVGGMIAGGVVGGVIEGKSGVPGIALVGALSGTSLGAVVVDRLCAEAPGAKPNVLLWSPDGKTLGAKLSLAF